MRKLIFFISIFIISCNTSSEPVKKYSVVGANRDYHKPLNIIDVQLSSTENILSILKDVVKTFSNDSELDFKYNSLTIVNTSDTVIFNESEYYLAHATDINSNIIFDFIFDSKNEIYFIRMNVYTSLFLYNDQDDNLNSLLGYLADSTDLIFPKHDPPMPFDTIIHNIDIMAKE